LTASAIVVAPGGVWPKLTNAQQAIQPSWVETDEPARQRRLAWLTGKYRSGRLLVAFGFDSLHLGQQELFKGMRFASTDQASVIWFGSKGAEYAPPNAMFSDKNLITAKPLVGVDEALHNKLSCSTANRFSLAVSTSTRDRQPSTPRSV
jgi:hypothetical protein